jgi:uncharacterized Fe-S cluster-containing protein
MSVLVPKLPSTVKFIPDQCNMTCYPADVVISGVAGNVVVVKVVVVGFSIVLTIVGQASGLYFLVLRWDAVV